MDIDELLEELQTELPDQTRNLDQLGDELLCQQKKIDQLESSIKAMLAAVRQGLNKE